VYLRVHLDETLLVYCQSQTLRHSQGMMILAFRADIQILRHITSERNLAAAGAFAPEIVRLLRLFAFVPPTPLKPTATSHNGFYFLFNAEMQEKRLRAGKLIFGRSL
jgi:hypothetical protein